MSDASGPLVTDPLGFYPDDINDPGNTVTYTVDGKGRVLTEVRDLRVDGLGGQPLDTSNPFNPDGRVTVTSVYDGNSRLVARLDDSGNSTSYVYDALDRVVERTFADSATHTFSYDRDGNLVASTDANGTSVTATYDALNRLTGKSILPAAGVLGATTESYEYDGMSRLTRADSSGASTRTIERVYDSLARTLEERQNGAVCSTTFAGDARPLRLGYPGGREIDHNYDPTDRLNSLVEASSSLGNFYWFGSHQGVAGDRLLKRENGNATELTYLNAAGDTDVGYDDFKRVRALRHQNAGGTFVDREYDYNRVDRRLSERRLDDNGFEDLYRYDSVCRVTETEYDQNGSPGSTGRDLVSETFDLDGVGNRREVTENTISLGILQLPYSVNAVNEYGTVNGVFRSHDDNGNLVDDGERLFSFDYRNRLVEVRRKSDDALIANYEYDALNRRTRKIVYSAVNPGVVTRDVEYLYDENFRVLEEVGPSGSEVSYVYGPGIDQPIQMVRTALHPQGAGTYYFHQNARGDVVAITDGSGTVVERTVYDAFGQPTQSSSIDNPYLFQGRRYDFETGLYYFRYRHYDPSSGRFLQRDPLYDPANFGNAYTFAGNDPTTEMDPFGLSSSQGRRNELTWGELWGGFVDSLTEDSWAARAHKAESEHLERSIELLMEDGHSPTAAFLLTIGVMISDVGGTTELHEAYENYDITEFVKEGNIRRLSTGERCLKVGSGLLKLLSAGMQGAQWVNASRVAAAELNAARAAGTEFFTFGRQFMAKAADGTMRQGSYRALSGHGSATGKFFRLPPNANVTVRFHGKYGKTITDQFGRVVDTGGSSGRYIYSGRGALVPEHILHAPDGLRIAVGNQTYMVKGSKKLSEIIAELAAKHPGEEILLDWAACRSPDGLLAVAQAFNLMMLDVNVSLHTVIDLIRMQDPVTAESIEDSFEVAPGLVTTGDVSTNDTAPPGPVAYELVTPPNVPDELFTFNSDGTFEISPLTFGSPLVTFSYKMVYSGGETPETPVTVEVVPSTAYTLTPYTDPNTGEEVVSIPCLVIGGLHYPIYQFILAYHPMGNCTPAHWHAFAQVFPLESPNLGISDPNQFGCGFGTFDSVLQANFVVTLDAWQDFLLLHIPPI